MPRPKKEFTVSNYCQYLISSQTNYTLTNYAEHVENISHDIIRGIGLLNCIYVNPETEQFWIIDYRIFDPDKDGKTKVDHLQDMLNNVVNHKKLPFKTVFMDSWYANHKLMLFIHDLGKLVYCPLKKNRLVKPLHSDDKFQAVNTLS